MHGTIKKLALAVGILVASVLIITFTVGQGGTGGALKDGTNNIIDTVNSKIKDATGLSNDILPKWN